MQFLEREHSGRMLLASPHQVTGPQQAADDVGPKGDHSFCRPCARSMNLSIMPCVNWYMLSEWMA